MMNKFFGLVIMAMLGASSVLAAEEPVFFHAFSPDSCNSDVLKVKGLLPYKAEVTRIEVKGEYAPNAFKPLAVRVDMHYAIKTEHRIPYSFRGILTIDQLSALTLPGSPRTGADTYEIVTREGYRISFSASGMTFQLMVLDEQGIPNLSCVEDVSW